MLKLGVNLSSDKKISQRLIFKDGRHVGQLIGTSLYIQALPIAGAPISVSRRKPEKLISVKQAYADVLMEFEYRLDQEHAI